MHENESLASQVLQAKTAVGPTDMQQATFMLPKKKYFFQLVLIQNFYITDKLSKTD